MQNHSAVRNPRKYEFFPTWPRVPDHYPVFLQWLEGADPILGVAISETEMRAYNHSCRLWFHIHAKTLCAFTSAEPDWFPSR